MHKRTLALAAGIALISPLVSSCSEVDQARQTFNTATSKAAQVRDDIEKVGEPTVTNMADQSKLTSVCHDRELREKVERDGMMPKSKEVLKDYCTGGIDRKTLTNDLKSTVDSLTDYLGIHPQK